jgi:hypothetical protein
VLAIGSYRTALLHDDVLGYLREHDGTRVLVLLNFSDSAQRIHLAREFPGGRLLVSTHLDRTEAAIESGIELRAHEGIVVELA